MFKRIAPHFAIFLGISAVSCSFVSVSLSQETQKPIQKYISLAIGNRWTYRVQIPKEVRLIVDPYVVHPWEMDYTSVTNGMLKNPRGPEEVTFTLKCVQAISDSSCKADVDEAGLQLWFVNRTTEQRLVIAPHDNFLILELHGVTEIGKDSGNPWILAQAVALVPTQTNQVKADMPGWRSGLAELLREPIRVPAGEFRKGFHSTIARRDPTSNPPYPDYTVESWTAEKVGLLKYVMKGADGNVMFTVELVSYEVK
jgi:hypothetical protein